MGYVVGRPFTEERPRSGDGITGERVHLMDATLQFSPHPPTCPLCGRAARIARVTERFFVDCPHCSTFLITEEGWHSLLNAPLTAREVANVASYNWEWSPCWSLDKGLCDLNEVNVRNMGRLWRKDDHHRLFQVLLRVLENTFDQRPFVLEFDDPMYLGMTASASPDDLRQLVVSPGVALFLPVIEDYGRAIRTCVSNEAISIMVLPLQIAPGIARTLNLDALRRRVA